MSMKTNFKVIITLGMSILTNVMYSGVDVYLENNYGAKLSYTTSSQKPEQYVGTNVRFLLGKIDSLSAPLIQTTSITAGYASPYNLKSFLDQIKNQQWQHTNDDAILSITPSGLMS